MAYDFENSGGMVRCSEGHSGNALRQDGRTDDENDYLIIRCKECGEAFPVDDSGDSHTRVETASESNSNGGGD